MAGHPLISVGMCPSAHGAEKRLQPGPLGRFEDSAAVPTRTLVVRYGWLSTQLEAAKVACLRTGSGQL